MTTATTTAKAPHKSAKARPADVCRLTLTIRGTTYSVAPLPCPNGMAWRLRKSDGTLYDVAETLEEPTCDCGDQTFRHEGLDATGCKHIRALRAVGLICHTSDWTGADDDTADASTWPAWTDGHVYSINRVLPAGVQNVMFPAPGGALGGWMS